MLEADKPSADQSPTSESKTEAAHAGLVDEGLGYRVLGLGLG